MDKVFDNPKPRKRNKNQLAILLSVVFHVCLIATLIFIYIPRRQTSTPEPPTSPIDQQSVSDPSRKSDSESKESLASAAIETSVRAHVETAASKPTEEVLADLDKKAKQLNQHVDERSIDQVAEAVAKSLGIERSQYQSNKQPVPGILDPETAQILEIVATGSDSKERAYEATMIDAQGHQTKVPMSESEGKLAYEAFQKMKQYPAIAGLYRQIVMPLLQKMTNAADQTQEPN